MLRSNARLFYSLRTRFAIGMGVIALPLVALAISGYFYFLSNLEGTRLIVEQVYERVMPVNHLQRLLQRAEITVHNHIIHHDIDVDAFLRTGREIDGDFDELLARLEPEQALRVAAAKAHWEEAQRFSDPLLTERLTTAEIEQIHARFAYRMRAVDGELQAMYDDVYDEIFDQVVTVVDNREQLTVLMRSILGGSLLITLAAGVMMMRSVVSPLRELKTGAQRLGAGEMDYRLPVRRRDEMGEVAEAFNAMASLIQETQNELRHRATRDGLTGLLNQREFTRRLHREFRRSKRYARSFALLILDLDHFKAVNDTHGHLVGDRALHHAAQVLLQELRDPDILARQGGEEFAAILPETSEADALTTAERLRGAIERSALILDSGQALRLTASIGVAVYPGRAETMQALFEEADDALYGAKHDGRNRSFYKDRRIST